MLDEQRELLALLEQSEGESDLGLRAIESFNEKVEGNSKFKPEQNTKYALALFTELRLPFHPVTLDTKKYSKKKPFMLSGELEGILASTLVKTIKAKCRSSKKHQDFYNKLFGTEWDTSNPEEITKEDIALWSKYKAPYHISAEIHKAKFSTSSSEFGETFLANLTRNELGEVIDKPISYEIFELERDLAFKRLAGVNERIENGDLKEKSEADQKAAKKACFQAQVIGQPVDKGFIRFLAFQLDNEGKDGVTEDNLINTVSENYQMLKFDFHWSGYDKIKEKLEEHVGSAPDRFGSGGDRHSLDYSFIGLKFGDVSDKPKEQRALELFTSHQFDFKMSGAVNDYVPGLEEKILSFMSDPIYNGEKFMMRSIYAFRSLSSSELLEKYKTDLKYNKNLIDEEIMQKYAGLLQSVDSSFSEKLMEEIIAGEREEIKSISDIMATESEITEEYDIEYQEGEYDMEVN